MKLEPPRVRVLLVDDDEDLRLMARAALELDGRFDVVGEGRDGSDAILIATSRQPDLVLLDLEMPWLDGAEAVPHIRRNAPGAMIALWTVAPESVRAADALAMGASVVLDKSYFGVGHLADHLMDLLASHRQLAELRTDERADADGCVGRESGS